MPQVPAPTYEPYRSRDFSPEGRKAALEREQPVSHGAEEEPNGDLDYFTQSAVVQAAVLRAAAAESGRPQTAQPRIPDVANTAPSQQATAVPPVSQPAEAESEFEKFWASQMAAPAASPSPEPLIAATPTVEPPVQTPPVAELGLTRRQLREMQSAAREVPAEAPSGPIAQTPSEPLAVSTPVSDPIDAILNSGPIDLPVAQPRSDRSPTLADVMAEFDALTTRGNRGPIAPDANSFAAPVPFVSAAAPVSEPFSVADLAPYTTATPEPSEQAYPVVEPHFGSASVEPIFIEPEPAAARPVGHWSLQPEVDDEVQAAELGLTRSVGTSGAPITTSALVLPNIPQATDLTSPLSSTGEVLVTGSIDLPRSLASTGAHPFRIDNSDNEEDPLDREVSSDSAPVRAIRAVSTHASTRGIMEAKKPRGNRVITVMMVTAGVLMVAVVALLGVALATGGLQ